MPFKNAEFPYRIQNVLECEFHLLETMDCCLILYHPYRPLLQVCGAGTLGVEVRPFAPLSLAPFLAFS